MTLLNAKVQEIINAVEHCQFGREDKEKDHSLISRKRNRIKVHCWCESKIFSILQDVRREALLEGAEACKEFHNKDGAISSSTLCERRLRALAERGKAEKGK